MFIKMTNVHLLHPAVIPIAAAAVAGGTSGAAGGLTAPDPVEPQKETPTEEAARHVKYPFEEESAKWAWFVAKRPGVAKMLGGLMMAKDFREGGGIKDPKGGMKNISKEALYLTFQPATTTQTGYDVMADMQKQRKRWNIAKLGVAAILGPALLTGGQIGGAGLTGGAGVPQVPQIPPVQSLGKATV